MAKVQPKQHVPIFVGSTFYDLKSYRQAVREALHSLETIVRGMEYFGSKPGRPLEECLQAVRSCKVYIGIFGMRYGAIPDGTDRSMTHLEYDEAQRNQLPSLIYLIDTENQAVLPKHVELGEGAERLAKFKAELSKRHVVSFFTSEQDLASKVLHDLPPVLEELGTRIERTLETTNPEHPPTEVKQGRTLLDRKTDGSLPWPSDGGWIANLGVGYGQYLNACGDPSSLEPVLYQDLAYRVAEPARKLGLELPLPNQSEYSIDTARSIGLMLVAQLESRSTRSAAVFEFVWRVSLMLGGTKGDGREFSAEERTKVEATLRRAAQYAGLLDEESSRIIHSIACDDLDAEQKHQLLGAFRDWVHAKTRGIQ